jgi:hypothetical protein
MFHNLKANEASVVQVDLGSRPSFNVYRPDGVAYVKLVMSFPTREAANNYVAKNNWELHN